MSVPDPPSRMRLTLGSRPATLLRLVLVSAAALIAAPAAQAGTYHVYGCRTPSGESINAEGWSVDTGPESAFVNSCATGGNLSISGGSLSDHNSLGATWNAGPNLTAVHGTIWRSGSGSASGSAMVFVGAGPIQDTTIGGGLLAYAETVNGTVGDPGNPMAAGNKLDLGSLARSNPSVPTVGISGGCGNWNGSDWCGYSYTVYAYDFTVSDAASPAVASLGGTLVSGGKFSDATAVSGTRTLAVNATDAGSGVWRAVLEVDGRELASAVVPATGLGQFCSPQTASDGLRAFKARQPCPLSGSPTLSFDTTTIPDGTYNVRVLVEDASGNRTATPTSRMLVRNAAPAPTATPTPTPTAAPGSTQADIGPGSPTAVRGPENGGVSGASVPDVAALSAGWGTAKKRPTSLSASWSAKGTRKLAGRLTTTTGAPIAGAQVRLSALGAWTGAGWTDAGSAQTASDGTFTAPVGLAAGTRTVRVQWFAHASDTVAGASASVRLTVGAATSIEAPTRIGRGATAAFGGRLKGSTGSVRGVPILVQALDHGTWKTVAGATTGGAGKWAAKVKFPTRVGRWKFRARVGLSATYPYAPGIASATITVRTH